MATEEPTIAPSTTPGTYEELKEAFKAMEQEKELDEKGPQEKTKEMEEEVSLVFLLF